MCESTVVIDSDNGEEIVMKDVIRVSVRKSKLELVDITGTTLTLSDLKINEIDSIGHRIVLTAR